MDSRRLIQLVWGFTIFALVLVGCAGTESVPPATAVPPTDTPIPTESVPTATAVRPTDTPIPIEQAIVGAWLYDGGTSGDRRIHVYTEDGKYCFGTHLPSLLEETARCKAYELDGNVLSEICTEESFGCTAGDICQVEVAILEDGRLKYFVPEACPTYPPGHPAIGYPNFLFTRVEEP